MTYLETHMPTVLSALHQDRTKAAERILTRCAMNHGDTDEAIDDFYQSVNDNLDGSGFRFWNLELIDLAA